jgi:hypothetical protein
MTDLFKADDSTMALDWRVEQLRCTAFLMPMFEGATEQIFRLITQSAPDQVAEIRQQARQTAAGEFANGNLELIKQPGRIDVLLSATDEVPGPRGVSTLANWTEAIEPLARGIGTWFQTRPELQRLAFGAVCQHEVPDRKSAYSILNGLLPSVDIDTDHSSDLFYQINRPRLARFQDEFNCRINRLSKWSAATVMLRTLTMPLAESGVQVSTSTAPVRTYCRVELDLNTDAEIQQLPSQQLEDIWNKLITFAAEILSKGDIP